ncbi:hypothetical protein MRB53_009954 [Persea americana]|uniref:Uncharacterized protein n=1 Tax=Persea americana TaxID=3435 RepID=A0ACC2LRH3_PERAE|nr:hypothetical protein MRB53_009954 [Persea americana]
MFMPMFKTAIFLVIIWCCYFYPSDGCLEEKRTHLLQIKDSINYPHGSSLDEDWVGKNCWEWPRIECNSSSSRMISIDLFSIRGEVGVWYPNASLFAAFKELEELVLSEDHIDGWVAPQAFSEMQSLRKLYLLSNNLFASIDSLQGLCEFRNLQCLGLSGSNLDGRVLPPCLSNLSKLEELSLSDNDLGSYSSALTGLCGLSALKYLDLSGNYFNDSNLPMGMGNFYLLESLNLSRNNLSGHFGNSTSGLKRLQELDLSLNQFTDDGISPWISNLTSLTTLWLQKNALREAPTP